MSTTRREQLQAFVRQNPSDAFARYGLAMDLKGAGENESALEQFRLLQQQHPDYPAGFHQAGQLLLALQRYDDARQVLELGLAAADRARDAHARGEMQELLDEIASQ